MSPKRIGLLGGYGQLGSEIRRTASAAGYTVVAPTSDEVDLRRPTDLTNWVQATKADVWINAAAYTAVDAAEDNIAEAEALNVDGPRHLTAALAAANPVSLLIYLSTDYVFSGNGGAPYSETAQTQPNSVYGATKLRGEQFTLEHPNAIVLRVSWVFGRHGHNFVKAILRAARRFAREGGALKVVDDQFGAPCGTRSITYTLLQLIELSEKSAQPGLYHMTTQPYVNWLQFAQAIVEEAVVAGLLEQPIEALSQPTSALNQKATRPPDGRLDGTKLQTLLQQPAPGWRDDLRIMLSELDPEELDTPAS